MAFLDNIFNASNYSDVLTRLLGVPQQQLGEFEGFPDSYQNYAHGGLLQPVFGKPQTTEELSAQSVKPQAQPQAQPAPQGNPLVDGLFNLSSNLRNGGGLITSLVGAATGRAVPTDIKPTDDIREYEYAKRQGFQGGLSDWMLKRRALAGKYGLTPIYGTGSDGKTAVVQLGNEGEAIQPKMPEGFTIAKDPIKIDAGTHIALIDPQSRQVIGQIPKDIAGKELQEKQGAARATLPTDLMTTGNTVKEIDELVGHKGFNQLFGLVDQFRPSVLMTDEGRDAKARLDQMVGRTFMEAYKTLKGGGQITEIEGEKATDAMARLSRAQSEEAARKALTDLRDAVTTGARKLKERAGVPEDATAPAKGGIDPIIEAMHAIARGAPREKVLERLKSMGINPSGL